MSELKQKIELTNKQKEILQGLASQKQILEQQLEIIQNDINLTSTLIFDFNEVTEVESFEFDGKYIIYSSGE